MSDDSSAGYETDSATARTTLKELSDTLVRASLDVVWRQWSAIGGMTSARRRASSLVDPEALALISLTFQQEEPRLADILADWTTRNSDLLSVQRMRNLAERYPASTRDALHGLARAAFEEGKDHRWKPLLRDDAPSPSRRRNKVRAARARPVEPAALVLRLRLAFGVGIKADVLAFLLGADDEAWAGMNAIATATGYTIAPVRKAIKDLAEAGLVDEMAGTRTEYHTPRAGWQALFGAQMNARWRGWNEHFVFVASFLDWARDARERPLTTYVLESRGRSLIEANAAAFRAFRVRTADHRLAEPADALAFSSAVRALAKWMVAEA